MLSLRRHPSAAWLAALIGGRLLIQLLLYRSGFLALTADEFARVVVAAQWAQSPYLLWSGVWLPFHMYLFGTALRLYWDLLYLPRALAMAAGALSLLLGYALTRQLFGHRPVALLSALLLALNPAHIWLSSTPLTEIFHTTLLLACLLGLVRFVQGVGAGALYLSATALALASGFRFEAWMAALVYSLLCWALLAWHLQFGRARRGVALALLVASAIPWLFPLAWMLGSYAATGAPIASAGEIRAYKLRWYGAGRSLAYYLPALLRIDPYATLLLLPALALALWRARTSPALASYLTLLLGPWALFLALHGGQLEPPGNYIRYLAPFVFLAYPLIAHCLDATLSAWLGARLPGGRSAALALLSLIIATTQLSTAFHFVNDPAADGVAVGQQIQRLRADHPELAARPILIELSYWQHLAVHVGANDLASVLYDRPLDPANRASQSLLLGDLEQLRGCLAAHNISHIALRSPELRAIAEGALGLKPGATVSGYVFYELPTATHSATAGAHCQLDSGAAHP